MYKSNDNNNNKNLHTVSILSLIWNSFLFCVTQFHQAKIQIILFCKKCEKLKKKFQQKPNIMHVCGCLFNVIHFVNFNKGVKHMIFITLLTLSIWLSNTIRFNVSRFFFSGCGLKKPPFIFVVNNYLEWNLLHARTNQ